jgi:ribosomal protein L22
MAEEQTELKEARAVARYVRMSPYKVRAVAELVRGMGLEEALEVLTFSKRAAARPLKKLIESAASNASQKYGFDREELLSRRCTWMKGRHSGGGARVPEGGLRASENVPVT